MSVGLPAIPSQLDRVFLGPGQDITHWIEPPHSEPARVELAELEFIFLTNQLSGLWLFSKLSESYCFLENYLIVAS